MMLADAGEADVANDHHLVVFLDEFLGEQIARILVQAGAEFHVHSRDTVWSFEQSLAVGVFADCLEDFPNRRANPFLIDFGGNGVAVGVPRLAAISGGCVTHALLFSLPRPCRHLLKTGLTGDADCVGE